jgi:hypothetical protein
VRRPSGFIEPCQPSKVARPPSGPLWVHEIKHDRYRLMVRRDGARVRCFTRGGHDWAGPFPAIVDSAHRIKATSVLIDGEAVLTRCRWPVRFQTACTAGIMRSSSTPSISWSATARISADCRSACARPASRGCWHGAWTAYSFPTSKRARSAPIYSAERARDHRLTQAVVSISLRWMIGGVPGDRESRNAQS